MYRYNLYLDTHRIRAKLSLSFYHIPFRYFVLSFYFIIINSNFIYANPAKLQDEALIGKIQNDAGTPLPQIMSHLKEISPDQGKNVSNNVRIFKYRANTTDCDTGKNMNKPEVIFKTCPKYALLISITWNPGDSGGFNSLWATSDRLAWWVDSVQVSRGRTIITLTTCEVSDDISKGISPAHDGNRYFVSYELAISELDKINSGLEKVEMKRNEMQKNSTPCAVNDQ